VPCYSLTSFIFYFIINHASAWINCSLSKCFVSDVVLLTSVKTSINQEMVKKKKKGGRDNRREREREVHLCRRFTGIYHATPFPSLFFEILPIFFIQVIFFPVCNIILHSLELQSLRQKKKTHHEITGGSIEGNVRN
jgi:hypothetical protein